MFLQYKKGIQKTKGDDFMSNTLLNEIMLNAKQVPLECQERILDILKGMAFTKKCLLNKTPPIKEQVNNERAN
jgi:hypothetical protein